MEKNCSFTTATTPGIVLLGIGLSPVLLEDMVLKVDFRLHQNIFDSNLRDSLDTFLEKNLDLTEEEVANPERMVGFGQ